MATVKCLACGHDNAVGEANCAGCFSSLNLKLCSACEAVNANSAARCHSCGADFGREAAAAAAATPATKRLPTVRAEANKARTRSSAVRAALLWALTVVAAGGAAYGYYRYEPPRLPVATGVIAAAIEREPAPVAVPVGMPEPESVPEPPQAAASAPAEEPVEPRIESPPRENPRRVTHTKAPDTSAARLPIASGSIAAATEAEPAPEPAPVRSTEPENRARITHTKAPDTRPASAGATGAKEAGSKPSAACPPGVAALGLCSSK